MISIAIRDTSTSTSTIDWRSIYLNYLLNIHSYYKSFVNKVCDQISTKGPVAHLFFAILDLFTCIGFLSFHFWVHQSKV